MEPVVDAQAMIAGMDPALDDTDWAFVTVADQGQALSLMGQALATFREAEGLSLIVPHAVAVEHDIAAEPHARITLQVHSALDGVGLTAAVSSALAGADIACNVVAAFHHDNLFVPAAAAEQALAILTELQASTT